MNLPVSGSNPTASDATRRDLLMPTKAAPRVGRWPLLYRWQPGIGHALRMTIVIAVAAVPLVVWPAYFSQLEGLLVGETPLGADFAILWSAATLAVDGRAAVVMDIDVFRMAQQQLVGETFTVYPWLYPPHLLVLIRPLGLVSYMAGWVLWGVAGFAAFAFASWCAARRFALDLSGVAMAGLLIAPAAMMNLIVGQIGFFTSALFIGGVAALQRFPVASGVLFGLLTVKPHMGILIPFLLLAIKAWRTIAAAVMTTAILIAVSLLVDGAGPWRAFFDDTTANQWELLRAGPQRMYSWMPSLFAATRRLDLPLEASFVVQGVVSVVAFSAVLRGFVRASSMLERCMLLAIGTFVVAPYALVYDMPVLVVATLLYVTAYRNDMAAREHWLWFAVWLLPFCLVFLGAIGALAGPVVLGAALAMVLLRIERRSASDVPVSAPLGSLPRVPIAP
jgi:alpha-1,2-mannosyltransferase